MILKLLLISDVWLDVIDINKAHQVKKHRQKFKFLRLCMPEDEKK